MEVLEGDLVGVLEVLLVDALEVLQGVDLRVFPPAFPQV
jgi:hypothetical protein